RFPFGPRPSEKRCSSVPPLRCTLHCTIVGTLTSKEHGPPVSPLCSKLVYECNGYMNPERLACLLHMHLTALRLAPHYDFKSQEEMGDIVNLSGWAVDRSRRKYLTSLHLCHSRCRPKITSSDTDRSICQTALLHRLSRNVRLFLLKVDMLERFLHSKSGAVRSPNNDSKSSACLHFMVPYRTLMDFDAGEFILMSEEKKKTAVHGNISGEFLSKCLPTYVHRRFFQNPLLDVYT
ncbi:hypothetical protein PHET_11795, partial [Paragonimus heterotremus]